MFKMPLLSKEQEKALTYAWFFQKDEKALHHLIKSYTRLVVSLWVYPVIVGTVLHNRQTNLLLVAQAGDLPRLFPSLSEDRKKNGC